MNLINYTYELVRQIPKGMISTYGAIAEALGDPIAARAVGRMMNQNPNPDITPCYKIVHSDGRIGGFGLGVKEKIRRLREDSIEVKDGYIVNFEKILFKDFKTDYPLKKLREEQIRLSRNLILEDSFENIETVAGIDVAYDRSDFEEACGACVVIDYKSKELIEKEVVFSKVDFPYIPTYFAYRELPIIEKLYKSLKTKPTVLMLDGNGLLHPRGFGLASHAGFLLDLPTIGVSKSLIYGEIEGNLVKVNNETKGYVFYNSRSEKPIYVSPGHKISFEKSLEIVKELSKYKIPEPLRLAHILARRHTI